MSVAHRNLVFDVRLTCASRPPLTPPIHQVIPEWVKKPALPTSSNVAEKDRIVQELTQYMAASSQATAKDEAASKKSKVELLSNLVSARAIDSGLASMGLRLADFRSARPLRPLLPGQVRYGLSEKEWPGGFGQVRRLHRSCLLTEATNLREIEVPLPDGGPRRLFACLDRGPCGWVGQFWLFTHCGISGAFHADPCHLVWTDIQGAVKSAGLWTTFLEISAVCSFKAGPWRKAAFFHSMRDCGLDYLDSVPPDGDDLLKFLYPSIAADLGMEEPTQLGSESHYLLVRQAVRDRIDKLTKGKRVKLCRWFSFFDAAEDLEDRWYVELAITLYMGLRRQWFQNINETPLFLNQGTVEREFVAIEQNEAPVGKAHSIDGAGQTPRDVANSAPENVAKKTSGKNMVQVASSILCSEVRRAEMVLMVLCVQGVKVEFNEMIRQQKTRFGCHEWSCAQARGTTTDRVMTSVAGTMVDESGLRRLRFQGQSGIDSEPPAQDSYIATKLVDFLREVLAARLKSALIDEWSMPSRFSLLVDPSPEVRQGALVEMRSWFKILTKAEKTAHSDAFMKKVLKDMVWPHQTWCREVLVTLWECRFEFVPDDLQADLRAYTSRLCTTKACEDGFNSCRDRERGSKAGILCPKGVWGALKSSSLADDCNRPNPPVTNAAKAAAAATGGQTKIPPAVFL